MIQTARKKILIIALPLIFLALVILNFKFFIKGTDWQNIFYPAVTSALKSGQPYSVTGFFNPPWVIPMLAPFVLLPAGWGASVFAVTGYFAFGFIAYKMGAKLPALIFFMLNPYTINHLLAPNAEWIAALGFILPPQIGLLFLLVPIGTGLFYLKETPGRKTEGGGLSSRFAYYTRACPVPKSFQFYKIFRSTIVL